MDTTTEMLQPDFNGAARQDSNHAVDTSVKQCMNNWHHYVHVRRMGGTVPHAMRVHEVESPTSLLCSKPRLVGFV